MQIKNEEDILQLVRDDEWMMEILKAAKSLQLPDWWVCAGFVRTKIWDVLHNFDKRTPMADVDVVYFDPANLDEKVEKKFEEKINKLLPGIPWSVKNEARMHVINDIPPYNSSVDAISKFPETVTALGLKLGPYDEVILTAPHGIEDVLNLEVKPTPYFMEFASRRAIYEERLRKKNWSVNWERVKVFHF
jgi:uncharacterized protein